MESCHSSKMAHMATHIKDGEYTATIYGMVCLDNGTREFMNFGKISPYSQPKAQIIVQFLLVFLFQIKDNHYHDAIRVLNYQLEVSPNVSRFFVHFSGMDYMSIL